MANHLQLAAEPRFELVDDDAAFVLAHRASLVRAAATDVRLDFIECIDARQGLAGNGRRAGCGEVIEAAAHMCPAERQFDVTALGHHTIREDEAGRLATASDRPGNAPEHTGPALTG